MSVELNVINVSKSFSGMDIPALNEVSLHVKKGDILALVGDSGSGKTTLLRSIAGFEMPDMGSIGIGLNVVFDKTNFTQPEKRKVGMVFQDYALFPHLNVMKNVKFGLSSLDGSEKNSRVAKYLNLVGLSGYEKRYPHELSGGQQQRVALARALAPEPFLLLMDEPFSNLDTILRKQLRKEVRAIIKKAGITAVLVTHNTLDALAVADMIAVLKDGRLLQVDSPHQIFENPNSAYVGAFFGKINIVKGTIVGENIESEFGAFPNKQMLSSSRGVELMIRPGDIQISKEPGVGLKVKVLDSSYLGERQELKLETKSGQVLETYLPGNIAIELGGDIYIKVDPSSIKLLNKKD